MNKIKGFFNSPINRRDFLKKKVLRSLALITVIPLYPFKEFFQSSLPVSESNELKLKPDKIDWNEIRNHFLFPKDITFLNTASLGSSPKIVIDKISKTLEFLAIKIKDGRWLLSDIRKKVSVFLNADIEEIAITRNTTEGINIAARSLPLKAGDEIILTKHEHVGGASPWLALQKDIGVIIKLIDLNLDGKDNIELIKENITAKTKVVFFSHITCTTGMILPAKEIVKICRAKKIYSIIDGAQAVGMIPINLKDINPDFYAGSGHKWLFGPKGTGILYINKSVIKECSPTFVGAYSDKKFNLNSLTIEFMQTASREEYGTRNIPLISGLGEAIDFISTIGIQNISNRGKDLLSYFRKGISELEEVEILTPDNDELFGSIITIRVNNKDNLEIRNQLSTEKSIIVRHIYENDIDGIRLSFSIFNSFEEVDHLLTALKGMIKS